MSPDFLAACLMALAAALISSVEAQFFAAPFNLIPHHQHLQLTPPPQQGFINFVDPSHEQRNLAHHVVVENAAREAQLPPELLNPFYKNPAIAAGLARESLITNKEFAVFNRDTEKIPRSEIFKIFQRAGFHDKF